MQHDPFTVRHCADWCEMVGIDTDYIGPMTASTYIIQDAFGEARTVTFPELCAMFADQYDNGENEAWRLVLGGPGSWQYDVKLLAVVG